MRAFAQKRSQLPKPASSSRARPDMATPGSVRRAPSIPHLQRTIGNQAVQRMLRSQAELKAIVSPAAGPGLLQRQTQSPDDQGDCSGWERDCESFCIRAARQYWQDTDGVHPPAIKSFKCDKPFVGPDGAPLAGLCIITYEGGLVVSVARRRGRTLTIWRTTPSQSYDGPSCEYEYHCTVQDGSLVLNKLSCQTYPSP